MEKASAVKTAKGCFMAGIIMYAVTVGMAMPATIRASMATASANETKEAEVMEIVDPAIPAAEFYFDEVELSFANMTSGDGQVLEDPAKDSYVVLDSTKYVVPVYEEPNVESREIGYLESGDFVVGTIYGDFIKAVTEDKVFYVPKEFMGTACPTYSECVVDLSTLETHEVVTQFTPIRSLSGLSIEDIENVLIGTELEGMGYLFYNTEKKYGINAHVMLGICRGECGFGDSEAAKNNHNLFGILSSDGSIRKFISEEDCVQYWANLITSGYIENGYPNLYKLGPRYCDSGYAAAIVRLINENREKIQKYRL